VPGKPPIIVIKRKGGHGGHHGGAWKVAYADFVTAMMALFIVLWLLSSSKPVKEAIAGYFKDPNFDKLKDHIEMTVTNEGLRIELLESAKGTFYDIGSANLNSDGQEIVITLAQELGKLPNKLAIEGHTDAKSYSKGRNYSNWELSADRANAARRLMQLNGVGENQVTQVRGFADQRLRKLDSPLDPSNRRISVIVQYMVQPQDAKAAGAVPETTAADVKPADEKAAETPAAKPASPPH
jgi:chemotaxis protein MotB